MKFTAALKNRRTLAVCGALLALAGLYLAWVPATVLLATAQLAHSGDRSPRLGLSAYVANIQAKPIEGLTRNISGLTYSSAAGTLFAVINRPASVAELSLDGRLLRHMPLPVVTDPEGISHVKGDEFLIADESSQRLYHLWTGAGADKPRVEPASDLALDFTAWHNRGLEGISWDSHRSELLLTNERWPQRVLIVHGLSSTASNAPPRIQDWRPGLWPGFLGRDLASVTAIDGSDNLLLLSEHSALVSEYTRDGRLVGVLPLWAGRNGLRESVPHPEGIAVDPDGAIYLVSEPNLFYRFAGPTRHARPMGR